MSHLFCSLQGAAQPLWSFAELAPVVQVKKLNLLIQSFETFERISLNPGNGDITLVELQVSYSDRSIADPALHMLGAVECKYLAE